MASLTLQQVSQDTYIIPAPANIGIYVKDKQATLIDSGNDKEAGRQILKLLKANNWTLDLIINTHSHADHIGGNAFLQKKTGCRIAATSLETAFIQHPVLEPAFLFGGFPIQSMKNKFLMAKPSHVTDIISSSGLILETGLTAFPLPGHCFEMIGIHTPDDVLFLADCVFSEEIIMKYHLFFLYDIQKHIETLQAVSGMTAAHYVACHAKPMTEIERLVSINTEKLREILTFIHSCCQEPASLEEILRQVCQTYHIELNANQYVLVLSTLKSYLAYLVDKQCVTPIFSEGKLFWKTNDTSLDSLF